ncbi:proline-rich protein 36-like [Megalobrama amblycephala]|uniref:proline-rich protein 36-like n=1 Tax=Megalobrama amblycephala TaxID=75352 RepID=UPI002013DEE9|nr:proline-rich protein 36-like [Megalobrama amblycephala]
MDEWERFIHVAQESQDVLSFSTLFFHLAVTSQLEDETLKTLFRIGVNFHGPSNLADITGLNWKEALLKCLECKRPQSRTLPSPVPSQRPTADRVDDSAVTSEPTPGGAAEYDITPEPERFPSEERFESAVPSSFEGVGVGDEGQVRSPAHPPVTESEFFNCNSTPQLPNHSILDSLVPPSLPLPHPLLDVLGNSSSQPSSLNPTTSAVLPKLSPISPTAPPSSPLSDVVTLRAYCEPPPSGREDPVVPPPASVLVSPPRPITLTPSPALLPPSTSGGTFKPSASRSFLGLPASPRSDVVSPAQRTCGPSVALRPSTPTALAGSGWGLGHHLAHPPAQPSSS